MISAEQSPPILLFNDNKNGSLNPFLEAEVENQPFSEPAPTESVRRVHHEADEPFVIELRPSESFETLIVNQVHTQNLTSFFSFMRSNKNKPILAAGEKVIQTMEKKFNEKMNAGAIQSLASEFSLETCCCRGGELPGYCSFCQEQVAASHMYVSTEGKCEVVSQEEVKNRRLFERAKESSKRILSFAGKSIDVFPMFVHTCYEAEICDECSNALRHYRWKKEYQKDNLLAEKMTIVEMYNQLYSQWSLLKYYCEKHLTICRKMKRCRSEKVVASFKESTKNFRKQLSIVRKESDQMDYYGQSTANSTLGSLQLEISHFTHRSCSLMQEKVSTANEDLKLFLEMERKVMEKEPPALTEIDLNSTKKKLIPLPLPCLPQVKKKSVLTAAGPINWIGSLFW
uniref:Uncharacterized protein n=1 Tax=Panagrolaimus sp. PS1159 TaxID=55785 RepID=A0AC35GA67_9BILA